MLDVATQEVNNKKRLLPFVSGQTKQHLMQVVGVSGIAMLLILPIGIIPRLVQSHELDEVHKQLINDTQAVSVTHVTLAPAQQKLSLPGSIEAIIDTPIYARSSGYIKERLVDIGDRVSAGQLLAKMETPEMEESENEAKAQLLTTIAGKETKRS